MSRPHSVLANAWRLIVVILASNKLNNGRSLPALYRRGVIYRYDFELRKNYVNRFRDIVLWDNELVANPSTEL